MMKMRNCKISWLGGVFVRTETPSFILGGKDDKRHVKNVRNMEKLFYELAKIRIFRQNCSLCTEFVQKYICKLKIMLYLCSVKTERYMLLSSDRLPKRHA